MAHNRGCLISIIIKGARLKMAFIDTTSLFGALLVSLTNNITGSLFLSLFFILAILIVICLGFRMPLELTIPLVLPFILGALTITGGLLPTLGVVILYLSILFTKRFFLGG